MPHLKTIGFSVLLVVACMASLLTAFRLLALSVFDSPDTHIRNVATNPIEANALKLSFLLPDELTNVYYFSSNGFRCDNYLHGTLEGKGVEDYQASIAKRSTALADHADSWYDLFDSAPKPIREWWPTGDLNRLRIYELRHSDYVMIDRDAGKIYVVQFGD